MSEVSKRVRNKIWVALPVELGLMPYLFPERPTVRHEGGKVYVWDFARNAEVEIRWCRCYRRSTT